MNGAFPKPHPKLTDFVVGLEKLTRRYFHLKQDIEIGRAVAPPNDKLCGVVKRVLRFLATTTKQGVVFTNMKHS
ncbi:hypothetical protein PHMEG_000184 [Phytophthora megakarya]|uniref:Uncharacterized protein n=1 Tax=Phytophthora megakarya TaxID=4795 RepID=A0A225X478_9STRA|nr:hypothetical protein PHMEG_000184 [Phytophthora megakarya]